MAGQGAVLLCSILWSASGLFIKLMDWHPAVIAGGRSLLAAAFLYTLRSVTQGQRGLWKNAPYLAASGLWYAACMILFVFANKLTASANAILLQYTAPVWAALLAWWVLREKPRWEQWGALALVGVGMLLVFRSGLAGGSLTGDVIALVSGLAFGANSVVLRLRKDIDPADIMLFSHLMVAVFSIPFWYLYPPSLTAGNIARIMFMGFFQIGAASALFAYGIRRVPAVQAMLIAAFEPLLNPVWVLLVTGEKPAVQVIIGGAIIIAAVVFSSASGRKRHGQSA